MRFERWISATALALTLLSGSRAYCADAPVNARSGSAPSSSPIGVVGGPKLDRKLAKIKPGVTTKAQVQSALGAPWRSVQYNDMDQLENEIWEYRGSDSDGNFRVHIEFDHHDIVHIIAKIPDGITRDRGTAVPAAPVDRQ